MHYSVTECTIKRDPYGTRAWNQARNAIRANRRVIIDSITTITTIHITSAYDITKGE